VKKTLLEDRPDWKWWAKSAAVAVVAVAGALKHTVAHGSIVYAVCDVVIAMGAALGIGSAGLARSR